MQTNKIIPHGLVGSKISRAMCGEKRCYYSFRIHEALARSGINATGLAKMIGVSRQAMSRVIIGKSHNPIILEALRKRGVPEKYLFDPVKLNDSSAE